MTAADPITDPDPIPPDAAPTSSVRADPKPGLGSADAVVVEGVSKRYRRPRERLFGARSTLDAVREVSLRVAPGERLGIVGESGSGKSTLARLMLGLEAPSVGTIMIAGRPLAGASNAELREIRRTIQLVFQDPLGSLDPRMTVRSIVAEPLVGLRIDGDHGARVREVLDAVGLGNWALDRYPHEFSGGQRQRIAIARALAPAPSILVADESVSALDVSVRNQVLNLLLRLTNELSLTLVFISHDLWVVRHMCSRVAVMREGRIVEVGSTREVYDAPAEPYTASLLAAVPTIETSLARRAAARAARVRPAGE
jgi:peptide/nickel transport system ATP-binding protein